MQLLEEMQQFGFQVSSKIAEVKCEVFEDNSGALEMAKVHKYQPRTKHLNVKLHHFRDYVEQGKIIIKSIKSIDQLADYLTKPVTLEILKPLRLKVMGW